MTDEAVSTVVGALLVLSIVVGATIIYQQTVVPNQKEKLEANHMDTVAGEMAQLDADLLRQLRSTSQAPLSSPVTLDRGTPLFVPDTAGSATLAFQPGDGAQGEQTTLSSPSLNIVRRDGQALLGSGSDWETVQSGETIEDITGVIGLRIKVTDGDPGDERLMITATNASGDYAGDLQVITEFNSPDLDLIVQTQEPPSPGSVIFHNHIISIHQQRWDSQYWIDAMLDLYWFDMLLADAEKPATLTFTDLGLDAEYRVSYEKQAADGVTTVVGAGQVVEDYQRSIQTGVLTYEAVNEYYTDQTLSIENGALLRVQDEGAAFLVDPPFNVQSGSDTAKVGLDVPGLAGEGDEVSGSGSAIVRTHTSERTSFSATAGELDVTWTTDHPTTWANFLEDELTDAGLTSSNCPPASSSSDCQFEVTTGSSSVTLDLHGPHATDADPSDPERDIVIDHQRATIQTEVRS